MEKTLAEDEGVIDIPTTFPPNLGITDVVRWATQNEIPLNNPPWEDAFCGSRVPAVYAGMVDMSNQPQSSKEKKLQGHAEWLVNHLSIKKQVEDDAPPVTSFPTVEHIIVVVDATDHNDPVVHFFIYDRKKTARKSAPFVKPLSFDDMEKMSRQKSSPLYGVRIDAAKGFAVELKNVILEHLLQEDEKRESAIKELGGASLQEGENGEADIVAEQ